MKITVLVCDAAGKQWVEEREVPEGYLMAKPELAEEEKT